ncbi:uncharacterized protein LOC143463543 [Clavelina lepadiformis]|uniref:uncharacterized protein LOC143463543 n=1 Tax=Clavelina lepadiformis TaxID=159417 RepID=UPI0040438809
MMKSISLLVFFATLSTAAQLTPCLERHLPPKGKLQFPPQNGGIECRAWYKWVIRTRDSESLKMVFNKLDIGDNLVKVIAKERHHSRWVRIAIVREEGQEVTVPSIYNFVKLIMKEMKGELKASYQVFLCPLPGPELTEGNCTCGYRRYSRCQFQCNSPEYFPRHLNASDIRATCRANQQWSVKREAQCVSLIEIERLCYQPGTNPNCPYNVQELTIMFFEKYNPKDYVGVVSNKTGGRLSRRFDNLDLQICRDVKACNRDPESRQLLVPECGLHRIKDHRFPCFICRRILQVCDVTDFIA